MIRSQQKNIYLSIADFSIKVYSDSTIEMEEGYLPFLKEPVENPDISIQCFEGLPKTVFQDNDLVFEAKNEQQSFYSIYRIGNELGFVIFNQQTNEIQQMAMLDESFTHWKVYSESSNNSIIPLKYPLGPIIMHYMTLTSDAVLMHASCAYDGKKGRLFSGFSGAGKSTISMLWAKAGSGIVNDDRLIIRKRDNGYFVYNTPMYYIDKPKVAPLNFIYLISHSPENKIKKLKGALAVSKVMAFCIQNNFEKQFIQQRLRFFSELCMSVPVFDLGFVPNESIVHFIISNESREIEQ